MTLTVDILTIFPEFFESPLETSILGRAIKSGRINVNVHDLRDYTTDKHRSVDDYPFGGGPGMVMKPEPLFAAVKSLQEGRDEPALVVLTSPQGKMFGHDLAVEWASGEKDLIVIAGHYEGVDQRVVEHLVDLEVSIGDYVLTGGEIPILAMIDAVVRFIPGVLSNPLSAATDSFADSGLLDHPHYTRPAEYQGMKVPDVLLSGNHSQIDEYRRAAALERTRSRRPHLLRKTETNLEQSNEGKSRAVRETIS